MPPASDGGGMKPRVTSFDIAFRAGVSQATVSRALRDSPLVSPETRQRVQQIARELNYTVDKNASSLRRQRAGTLALLLFEDPTGDESSINPFFMSMLASITRACARRHLDLLVSFQQTTADWHAEYQDSHRADGVILLGYGDYLEYRPKLERLVEEGTHFVRWGPAVEDQHGISICCDNHRGGFLATRHLLDLGRRRIAWIGTATLQCPEFLERYMGHGEALAQEGIALSGSLRADASDSTEETGYRAMRTLLERGVGFDALFTASDLLAIGAMRALAEAGRRVPEDVAVVGFDDIPMASFVRPALTTVMQDTRLAGERLVASLLAQIAGEAVVSEFLPPKLVVRKSCGAPLP
jgi:DNA-binding LacI/PurR family transcriptional regulator